MCTLLYFAYRFVAEAEMDFVEAVVYGNVNRDGLKCSNHSVKEMEGNTKKVRHAVHSFTRRMRCD